MDDFGKFDKSLCMKITLGLDEADVIARDQASLGRA
jgi:hypothetical protein